MQTSLMVAGPAAADAVSRAKRLPQLKVGLHLVLVEGDSVLGHSSLPSITEADGRFGSNQLALGFRYFLSRHARQELTAEIRAQFDAFRATGLPLHHADCHKHMHLHPTVSRLMIDIGKDYGLRRIRIPAEPPSVLATCGTRPALSSRALYLWSRILRSQARRAGLLTPDFVFGIAWSGHMTESKILQLLKNLPTGCSEIYFHPATHSDPVLRALMPEYQHRAEYETLLQLRSAQSHVDCSEKSAAPTTS